MNFATEKPISTNRGFLIRGVLIREVFAFKAVLAPEKSLPLL
jgi:hypothetical protein